MNAEPCLEVWKFCTGVWTWTCWDEEHYKQPGTDHDTHAEALAAALAHCAKAGQR